jgi:FtsH-binding integral membrane protein
MSITAPTGCGAHVEETVMTATQIDRSTVQTTHGSRPSVRRVLAGGIAGTAAGTVVLFGYGALAVAIHGPMQVAEHGASHAVPLTAASFAIGVVFCAVLGSVLAMAFARWAADPARTFLGTAIVLTVVSLAAPLAASHTTEATRLILAAGHVIAAVVVIPVIVRSLRGRVA